ncbi:PAS domain S-box protein [Hoeflea prorocentri]|uniref:Sensor protein FixL n=1 Tax=Hoeflea prorocentri TaxID=1922333 RepID=A0A9X3UFB0_9HYPH|nr:PAS domain S-box protein [Hoeflea prorocentri]MCY6379661.1 PAS domain S-box protein [Hoeflea prorocentri]MDA5397461.1 PAS domain S-box protein [Hoeflea prorocentri]
MKTPHEQASITEALLEAAVDSIITIDSDGLIQSANRSTEQLFGYELKDLIGNNVSMLMPEQWAREHNDNIRRYIQTGEKHIIGKGREVIGRKMDGTSFPIHLAVGEYRNGDKVYFCGIIHDLTARKNTEQALERSQRLEAIGQLTGGIAHDFNNLLTIITGNLELLERKLQDSTNLELLKEASEAAELGANLTDLLLAFARRSVLRPKVMDVNALVENLFSMLRRTLGIHVEFDARLSKDLWPTLADPGQVETALLNLAVNARDAMPAGGSLFIETSNTVIDEHYSAREIGVEPGDYIRISVSDTGVGMTENVLEKAFEPFFTTKQSGRGTGLGLSTVYGFAKQSGGNVTIYSEEGFGTTVNLYLPRHDGVAEAEHTQDDIADQHSLEGRGELVLVVEDDPRVRKLTVQRLEILNYRTVSASDGQEALNILKNRKDIDVVFTDLVMPGRLSGYGVVDAARKMHPDIGILMTSGFAEDLLNADRLSNRSLSLLRKPYRQADLARVLRTVIEADD